MLRASLEDAGFEVVTAYSGLAAVAALENHDVDVAVLDVLMPGISGDAVAQRLRQVDPALPVLLLPGADGAFASRRTASPRAISSTTTNGSARLSCRTSGIVRSR